MTWQMKERILTGKDLGIADEETCSYLEKQAGHLWRSLREESVSDDVILSMVDEQKQYLSAAGFIARSGIDNSEPGLYERSVGELTEYLLGRMEVLDQYYDAEE